MASVQKQFEKFHDTIKLDNYDENATLREKRDLLIEELKDKLPTDLQGFDWFNQGSYAIGTGINPKDGNYDIDVGLVFKEAEKALDPVDLKIAVRDALTLAKRTVLVRRPCVTVEYQRAGDPIYHVDLALYTADSNDNLKLAVGKEHSEGSNVFWQVSDPKGLKEKLLSKFSEDERKQFQRIVRYLKRWRDQKFSHDRLISIAITVATWKWLQPSIDAINSTANDAKGLEGLLTNILGSWSVATQRLEVKLPVEPGTDLLEKMTDAQMKDLQTRIQDLRDALRDAQQEPNLKTACQTLARFFGDEFPIPDDDDRTKVGKSYVSTGTSA